MLLNSDNVLFWMDAIRNSKNPSRVLDSFWKGQVNSKIWLIENLTPITKQLYNGRSFTIDIHGGWYGVLASLLFQSNIPIQHITSLDIDPECADIAKTINKPEEIAGRFFTRTIDMLHCISTTDILINTSCEHLTQLQYDMWLAPQAYDTLFVLQSNNLNIDEHIRQAHSLEEFKEQSKINVQWAGELVTPYYTRYMLIGTKHE